MKTQLRYCFVVLGILSALYYADAKTIKRLNKPAGRRFVHQPVSSANRAGQVSKPAAKAPKLDSVTRLLRLKLYLGPYDYDDIVIAFNSGASVNYDPYEDSRYLAGINAAEGLASLSNDGMPLSINFLPLPAGSTSEKIRLDIEAQSSGPITLKCTELDTLPKTYHLLLVDKYAKDSVDLRTDSNYVFNINKADTNTYKTSRFEVLVYQDAAPKLRLLSFAAEKNGPSAQINWTTQNEAKCTHFAVERSIDGGVSFAGIDSLLSTGSGSYSFTDNAPPQTADAYRLKMTDLNGLISFSDTVTLAYNEVTIAASSNAINLYPNPTSGAINLTINSDKATTSKLAVQSLANPVLTPTGAGYSIRILNVSGATVKTATSPGGAWQGNISGLSAGTYVITVVDNGSSKVVGRSTFVKL